MGLEKAIEHKKEHRKPYRGSKAIDCSCRNHGTCGYCLSNRLNKNTKREQRMAAALEEYCVGENDSSSSMKNEK